MTVSIHTATSHAQSRMQQRGIPLIVVDLLDVYAGSARASTCATPTCFDTPASWRRGS